MMTSFGSGINFAERCFNEAIADFSFCEAKPDLAL
jgi:hypothetical protein